MSTSRRTTKQDVGQAAQRLARQGFRVFPVRKGDKHPLIAGWPEEASGSRRVIRRWWRKYPNANVAILTGDGFIVVDVDGSEGKANWVDLCKKHGKGKVPRTVRASTPGGGEHLYFTVPKGCVVRNSAGKLTGKVDVRGHHGYVVAPPSLHQNGGRYQWTLGHSPEDVGVARLPVWLLNRLEQGRRATSGSMATGNGSVIPQGQRNNTLTGIAGRLRRAGAIHEAILVQLQADNRKRCKPPLPKEEVEKIARSVERYSPASPAVRVWPAPLAEEAFHGLAGKVVRAIEPRSEADPAALLLQLLVLFGNCIGSTPSLRVEADDHGTNEFLVLVGKTAKGRKGTAFSQVLRLFQFVDEEWKNNRIIPGLVSGEGLVWFVRDPTARRGKDGEALIVDPGVDDKRLLVFEPEFASVLKVGSREGNTLSPVVRQAWDSRNLSTLAKHNPARASGAHISIIGHVTVDELRRYLTNTEMLNGFANRFLWVCVKRSQLLPFGSAPNEEATRVLSNEIRKRVETARTITQLKRSPAAKRLWARIYRGELAVDHGGLLGAATARADPHVVRLSVIYALLDGSRIIKTSHLKAALAVWRYCRDSAEYIFGHALGDPIADRILAALRRRPKGMTRTDIRDLFQNNQKRERIDQALESLGDRNLAVMEKESRAARGRPSERWFAMEPRATT